LQDRDRDRIQDPTTHDGFEPIQDQERLQDRDRIQNPTIHIGDEPVQDRDQLRDRLQDRLDDPDQDRDRIRANDSAGLQQIILVSQEVAADAANGLGEEVRELARNRNRVEVGVMTLIASQNMVGPYGRRVSDIAQEIGNAHRAMIQNEEQMQSRSWLRNLLFGGDSETAEVIQNQLRENEQRIEQVRQYLKDCNCDVQVQNMLQEQLRSMEEEHARLGHLAEAEVQRRGIFSWKF
jgi:hypothetical protein